MKLRGIVVLAVVAMLTASANPRRGLPFDPIADVPLGGNATRLDYQSLDSGNMRSSLHTWVIAT